MIHLVESYNSLTSIELYQMLVDQDDKNLVHLIVQSYLLEYSQKLFLLVTLIYIECFFSDIWLLFTDIVIR